MSRFLNNLAKLKQKESNGDFGSPTRGFPLNQNEEEDFYGLTPSDYIDRNGKYINIFGLSPIDPDYKLVYTRMMQLRKNKPAEFKKIMEMR